MNEKKRNMENNENMNKTKCQSYLLVDGSILIVTLCHSTGFVVFFNDRRLLQENKKESLVCGKDVIVVGLLFACGSFKKVFHFFISFLFADVIEMLL